MDGIFRNIIACLTLAAVIDNGMIFTHIQSYKKHQENHFLFMIKNINNHICFMEIMYSLEYETHSLIVQIHLITFSFWFIESFIEKV